jgi:L-asparaginase
VSGVRRTVVALISLGGTIAMSGDPGGVVIPRLNARELTATLGPAVGDLDVRARSVRSVPGASLGIDDVYDLAAQVDAERSGGADGVVISQGTDTLEETAFLLDLLLEPSAPVVITGAMRNPTMPGADGPANLTAALLTAASGLDLGGVVVVLDDDIHAAARVQKSHTTSSAAFTSDHGPLGYVSEGRVVLRSRPATRLPTLPRGDRRVRVPIVMLGLGDDGSGLRAARGADGRIDVDGLVLAALGAGHTPEWLVDPLAEVAARIPVVLTSRTRHGPVLRSTYGFGGSEVELRRRGLLTAGLLDPIRARILLIALLRAGLPGDEIRARLAAADDLV